VKLRIGYNAVLKLIHSGELPTVNLPERRGYLIEESELDRLIAKYNGVRKDPGSEVGSFDGSHAPVETVKAEESRALLEKSRRSRSRTLRTTKYEWMGGFRRKDAV